MRFNAGRMAKLSGLLREGKETEECDEADEVKETAEVEESDDKEMKETDETYEVDEADCKEIEESIRVRRLVRQELSEMWASGQVFGKKAGKPKGVTMGFTGIGFKK